MKALFAVLFATMLSACAAPSHRPSSDGDRQAIEQVVEAFRVSIIKKDKEQFMKLFYSDSIPWIGVTTDNSLARINAKQSAAGKEAIPKIRGGGNLTSFIEDIVGNPNPVEETFDNVRIDSDGDVAQVWFDYVFVDNGYKANAGKEAWHMVRTANGWKINSVIWSMEFNPVPRPVAAKPAP